MASIYPLGERWRAQVRRAGQKSISRVFDTRREAEAWARALEHQADRGRKLGGGRSPVRLLLNEYRAARGEAGRPIRRQSNEHYMLEKLGSWFATTRLDGLTTGAIRDYARARRRQGAGPYTVNMELSKLGTALRYACSLLEIPYADPVATARPTLHHLGLIGAGKKRERRPTADEWTALLAELAKLPTAIPMVDIVTFAAMNALRRGEVCRITWTDLDVEARTVVVRDRKDPRRKAGNDEVVPLIGDSLDIIMRQPRPREGEAGRRIFPFEPGTVSKCFAAARKAAGIVNLTLHDMRHEATSRLFEAGWQIPEVAAVTGHKRWDQLKRYTNLRPQEIARKKT